MSLSVRVAGPILNRHHVSQMSSNPSRLSPLIVRFKAWRTAQGLSQSKAASALADAGLPIALARAERAIAPVIARLMEWRRANGLSQAQAVGVLCAAGLPAKIKTLQAWEIGRNSPQSITAAALEQFLDQHPAPTRPRSHRTPPPQS